MLRLSRLQNLLPILPHERSQTPAIADTASPDRGSIARIPALDGLRGVAILAVFLHHGLALPRTSDGVVQGWIESVSKAGWIGVDLFFVISGFLITAILLNSMGRRNWLGNFYARRALRVLPLYYAVVFICLVVLPSLPYTAFEWLRDLSQDSWWYWLHLSNLRKVAGAYDPTLAPVGWFSTYWSLAIEEHFYLVWPVILLSVGKRRALRCAFYGVFISTALRFYLAFALENQDSLVYSHTLTRLDGLFLGSALATYRHAGGDLVALRPAAWTVLAASLLAFAPTLAFDLPAVQRQSDYGACVLYSASVWGGAAFLVLCVSGGTGSRLSRIACSASLTEVGKYSYAIYVFNKPIYAGVACLAVPLLGELDWLEYALAVVATFALCYLAARVSWIFLERPFLSLKRHFN